MSIIPVRCFTCGKVIADKYRFYQEKITDLNKIDDPMDFSEVPGELYEPRRSLASGRTTAIRKMCDTLQLERCCVKTMMTHVDIE
jgi:DNA-directed RNA polymerase I, II, and III subunit RPABC5